MDRPGRCSLSGTLGAGHLVGNPVAGLSDDPHLHARIQIADYPLCVRILVLGTKRSGTVSFADRVTPTVTRRSAGAIHRSVLRLRALARCRARELSGNRQSRQEWLRL